MKLTSRDYIILLCILAKDSGNGVNSYIIEKLCSPFDLYFDERYEILDRLVNNGIINLNNGLYMLNQPIIDHLKQIDIYSKTERELNRKNFIALNFLFVKGGYQESIFSRLSENKQHLINLLDSLNNKISEEDDFVLSEIEPIQLKNEIHELIKDIAIGEYKRFKPFSMNFATTSKLQEHSISNGWGDEFVSFALEYEALTEKIST